MCCPTFEPNLRAEYILGLINYTSLIYIGMVIGIFGVLCLFDTRFLKTLNELKYTARTFTYASLLGLFFLSLAGIPPLAGFVAKFLLFMIFISQTNPHFLFTLILFNLFALMFYTQNVRFLVSRQPRPYYVYKHSYTYVTVTSVAALLGCVYTNLYLFLFVEDCLVCVNSVWSSLL